MQLVGLCVHAQSCISACVHVRALCGNGPLSPVLVLFVIVQVLVSWPEAFPGQCCLHLLNLPLPQVSNRRVNESPLIQVHCAIEL